MLLNKANPISLRHWWFPVTLILISLCIELGGEPWRELFRYQSNAVSNTEYWRLITGHLSHLGWSHWLLNSVGLGLVFSLFGALLSTKQWTVALLVIAFNISVCFLVFDKNLNWYVGLSGVLHGLMLMGALIALEKNHAQQQAFDQGVMLLVVIILVKLLYEQTLGAVPLTAASSGGPVIVNAHLYGAIIGTIYALILILKTRVKYCIR